jgi:hypothetical protein
MKTEIERILNLFVIGRLPLLNKEREKQMIQDIASRSLAGNGFSFIGAIYYG